MKSFKKILILAVSFWLLATGNWPLLFGQGTAGPVAGGTAYGNLEVGFTIPGVSWAATGLTLTYTSGTVYQSGKSNAITGSTLSLTDSKATCTQAGIQAASCNIVYWASGTGLSNTTTYATAAAAGNRLLYFCTTTGGNITGCAPASLDIVGPVPASYADGALFISPANCWMTPTTTAFTAGPALVRAAANNQVLSATTNTTGGTIAVTCDISFEGRTTANLGFIATDVSIFYGVQTTNLSSIAAATVTTVTYPSAGGSASGTVANADGTLTVTPGTLQKNTTTSGQCYNENIAFGTPFSYTDLTKVTLDQVFTTAGTTATTLQICGLLVHGTWVQ